MAYDYPNKYLWDIPRVWNIDSQLVPMRLRIQDMARPGKVDFDAIIDSPYGEQMVSTMKPYILYEDEMDSELLKYYESIGLKKELYESGDIYTKWSCYTPLSMYELQNKDRLYPLLFVLHGGSMPIHWEESTGFLPIAGREEMIVVSPQNHNESNIMRILDIVKSKYPVDESRIYSSGYSQGGRKTNEVSLRHPEIFAAVGPCGMYLYPEDYYISPSDTENVRSYDLPVIIICGQEESLEMFPVNENSILGDESFGPDRHSMSYGKDPTRDEQRPRIRHRKVEDKVDLLQKRLYSMRCRDVSLQECIACRGSDNEVERNLGFPCDETEIKTVLGVRHFVGDFFNDEGENTLRFISVEGQPHWPIATMPELVWDFMKRFRRDPVTKELIISE
ncbi:MAG: hypothetical protein GX222_05575 [Ruminococcaceae bacterium]|nr:hypothetical protein [Oscillospiraceae bacterium]